MPGRCRRPCLTTRRRVQREVTLFVVPESGGCPQTACHGNGAARTSVTRTIPRYRTGSERTPRPGRAGESRGTGPPTELRRRVSLPRPARRAEGALGVASLQCGADVWMTRAKRLLRRLRVTDPLLRTLVTDCPVRFQVERLLGGGPVRGPIVQADPIARKFRATSGRRSRCLRVLPSV